MCGIVGWAYPPTTENTVEERRRLVSNAVLTLRKRGPDAFRTEVFPGAVLSHARLSILDLSDMANQPMTDSSGRYVLIFNGEIFNYKDLRDRLRNEGIGFRTTSDTEVLLQYLIQYGPPGLAELNGFWALAFYDTHRKEMLLARDRYGIKPLQFISDESGVRFASEPKALLATGHKPVLYLAPLPLYFQLNYLPPGHSLFQGIQHILPGEYRWVRSGRLGEAQTYYRLPPPNKTPGTLSYNQAQANLEQVLNDAVGIRLVADVPVGVFLSGGLDSSIIAAISKRHSPLVYTFSIGFEEKIWDETPYAELVSRHIGTKHTVFRLNAEKLYENLDGVLEYLSEPFADASAINVFILSKETRQHVKVALSGDGADELFGGYHRHLGERAAARFAWASPLMGLVRPWLRAIPSGRDSGFGRKIFQLQRLIEAIRPEGERYQKLTSVLIQEELSKLLAEVDHTYAEKAWEKFIRIRQQEHGLNGFLRADIALVLAGDMLPKVDLMSMAHGLEIRPPFLDFRVVNLATSLPSDFKIKHRLRKRILQDTFRSYLPPELYRRPKQGFEVPLTRWFQTRLRDRIENDFLNREFVESQGIFQYAYLQNLWSRVLNGSGGKADWTLWAYLVFQNWYKRYWS